jgi:hypothetical protein
MSDDYVWEKLWVAVEHLASSAQPLARRLDSAAVSALMRLEPEDFTDQEQRRAFEGIILAFSADPLRGPSADGSISDAMARIDEERAIELAKSIVSLYDTFLRSGRDSTASD